jgi:glycine dehydrogenase subunit 2
MAGLEIVEVPSNARGNVDLAKLMAALDERVAGLMLTSNTLGLFEESLLEVTRLLYTRPGVWCAVTALISTLSSVSANQGSWE